MPCNMYDGVTSGDFAQSAVSDLRRDLVPRVAELEQALCGACRMLETLGLDSADVQRGFRRELPEGLKEWWEKHQKHPGHVR